MRLSVVLPMHNEVSNVETVVRSFDGELTRLAIPHEIIAVDDGSDDGTGTALVACQRSHPYLRIVSHAMNRGYGAALRSGFYAARGEYVFFTDADGQFGVEELVGFLDASAPQTVIAGYRVERSDRRFRVWNAGLWKVLIFVLFGLRVRDIDCAYKMFPRTLLTEVELVAQGAFVSVELLLGARKKGYRFIELPVSHRARIAGAASGARPIVIARAFRELASYYLSRR